MKLFCCGCQKTVEAQLVNGQEIYGGFGNTTWDNLPFWRCPTCKNYIGCHPNKPYQRRKNVPLGTNIPTPEIRKMRNFIHNFYLDPMWKSGQWERRRIYAELSKMLGETYHTGNISSIRQANKVILCLKEMRLTVSKKHSALNDWKSDERRNYD